MRNKQFLLPTIIIILFTITFAEDNLKRVPQMEPGKAQIVIYRFKTLVGSGIRVYLYNVTIIPEQLSLQSPGANSILQLSETRDIHPPIFSEDSGKTIINCENAKRYSKNIHPHKNSNFKIGQSVIFNVTPGTYCFYGTSIYDINSPKWNTPPSIHFLNAEPDKQYFIKADVAWGGAVELSYPTAVDAKADLKWNKEDGSGGYKIKRLQLHDICTQEQMNSEPVASYVAMFNSNKDLYDQGRGYITRGNLSIFLGMPLSIAAVVTICAIVSENSGSKLPMVIAGPAGGAIGSVFLIRGINLKKKGRSDVRNATFNMKELKAKIEDSCK